MIPRYQRILFWSLALAILLMAAFLLRGRQQAREKLTRQQDQTPLAAPTESAPETVHLAMASDADGSITSVDRQLALPADPTVRARVLLAESDRRIFLQELRASACQRTCYRRCLSAGPAAEASRLLQPG